MTKMLKLKSLSLTLLGKLRIETFYNGVLYHVGKTVIKKIDDPNCFLMIVMKKLSHNLQVKVL